ncbi:MAG: hypothetical protein WC804_05695 [Sphingomonas sp.]|jgi:hypothetical protein
MEAPAAQSVGLGGDGDEVDAIGEVEAEGGEGFNVFSKLAP